MTQEQKAFIERVGALAAADMQKSGVLASLTIAQAILESGWGKSGLTVKANALFGIKAGTSWKGRVYSTKTQECYDGVNFTTVTALFRAYDSWEESVEDHSALLTGAARYKAVVGERDYKTACRAIKAAGYATDPKYPDKLIQIIESYGLTAYDGAGQAGAGGGSNITAGAERPADAKGEGKMKASEFIKKLQDIVDHYKTLYVMGCFGAPLTGGNVSRYCQNHSYNKQAARTAMIKAAANQNPPVFGFDCVCMIKGVLWGWNGDASKTYGGASYASGGVPDIGADTMITKCSGVSTDFSKIVPGEAVWLKGHIGVYIGGGKVIECSPAFKNCVQVTACLNIGAISGMNGRRWTKHGKLPYITYDTAGAATGGAGTAQKPGGASDTSGALAFAVGDVVQFTGNTHYTSAAAASGKACKPGPAKVTMISKGAKHPYHLIKQAGGGSTVYGWVNAADVQSETDAAIDKLAELGVINSPDYWKNAVAGGKVAYLDILFTQAAAQKPGGASDTSGALAFAVGDVVQFTGNTHYTSAAAASGKACKPGPAKVTMISKGAKHPYHLIKQAGGGSTVYGWVNAADVQSETDAAIDKLAELGVINSPDYWKNAVAGGKVAYLDILFTQAAAKITKAGPRTADVKSGVDALVKAGVINTPEYWLQNYGKLQSLDLLLCALGGAV